MQPLGKGFNIIIQTYTPKIFLNLVTVVLTSNDTNVCVDLAIP